MGSHDLLTCVCYSDAFAGGFVAGVVEGKSLHESVDMGHWLASLSIRELGPQYVHYFTSLEQSGTHVADQHTQHQHYIINSLTLHAHVQLNYRLLYQLTSIAPTQIPIP